MAMCYWICEGIGFEQGNLLPLLDGNKLKVLFNEVTENDWEKEWEKEWENDYGVSTLPHDKTVEAVMAFIDGSDFNNKLPELLQYKDEKGVLNCANDNDGQYFLLYSPRYPWNESGGFTSQYEVVKYLYDLLRPFCRDDVTKKELLAIIDVDIYAHGCG